MVEKKLKKAKAVKKSSTRIPGLKLEVYDLAGHKKEPLELPKEIFSSEASPKLLAQYVRVYLANQRQGTASTKTRGEVAGSTRKIYRQKGTGRARHGARTAHIFVGGGVYGGPRPKDSSLKINKKQRRKALFGALTLKNKEGAIIGLAASSLKTEVKTRTVAIFLKKIESDKKRTLLILPKLEKNNLVLSSRNIPTVKLTDARSINPYEVLRNKKIIFVADALVVLKEHFLKKNDPSTSAQGHSE